MWVPAVVLGLFNLNLRVVGSVQWITGSGHTLVEIRVLQLQLNWFVNWGCNVPNIKTKPLVM